jgi:hypothetical protein
MDEVPYMLDWCYMFLVILHTIVDD